MAEDHKCLLPEMPLNNQQRAVVEGLEQLYTEKVLCDLTLQAENECVQVHKCVLAASSPYFRAMFTLDTCERSQETVKLHSVAGYVLLDLVRFLYTGKITLNETNAQALVTAASMLQIQTLEQQCETYMCTALCIDNCIDIYNFADFQNLETLKCTSESFVIEHFSEIYLSKPFLQISLKNLTKLLNSDELNVSNEECVYQAIIAWVKHDLENRKRDLILLLFCLRFSLLDISYIEFTIACERLISENAICRQLVSDALTLRPEEDSDDKSKSDKFSTKPRLGMHSKKMLVFSGGAYSVSDRAFGCFDPQTYRSFYAIKQHPTFDFKFKIDFYKLLVTESNEIYFLGGVFYDDYHFEQSGAEAKDTVLLYSQKENVWKECPSMPSPRCAFAACCHANKIYIFGGYRRYPGHPPISDVAVYDTDTEVWRRLDEMPAEIAHQASTVYQNNVFLFGGLDLEKQYLNIVLQYNISRDQWTLINTEMPKPCAEASAFTHNDKMYVLGGQNLSGGILSVSIFNPEKLRWTFGEEFPEERKFTSVTKNEDYIYVCGGVRQMISRSGALRRSKTVETKDLFIYHIGHDVWAKRARIVEHGSNYACVFASVNTKLLKEG